jgi:hypothetical protein
MLRSEPDLKKYKKNRSRVLIFVKGRKSFAYNFWAFRIPAEYRQSQLKGRDFMRQQYCLFSLSGPSFELDQHRVGVRVNEL